MIFFNPKSCLSSRSHCALLTPGLRLSLSTQLSVIMAVPCPSTSMPPPSRIKLLCMRGTPACLATNAATLASRLKVCFSPQPLKLKSTPAFSPFSFTTNTGPVSRIHKSSSGKTIRSILSPISLRATAKSSCRTNIETGSYRAIVSAIVAKLRCTSGKSLLPHTLALAPKAIQVRLCGSPSSGITQPAFVAATAKDSLPVPNSAPAPKIPKDCKTVRRVTIKHSP